MKFMKSQLLVIAFVLAIASSSFASLSYNVSVDTTSLAGSTGYLYFEYVTGVNNSATSIATLGNFVTDGTLGVVGPNAFSNSGTNVTGSLPGSVSFTSGIVALDDYNQAITFGNSINYSLLLPNGTAGTNGTNFVMQLFSDAGGMNPLKTSDGTLFTLNLNADGTSGTIISDAGTQVTATPIPAAAWLLGSGLMGLVGIRKKLKI